MLSDERWTLLGWRHPVWDLLRYYCSLRSQKQKKEWATELKLTSTIEVANRHRLPVPREHIDQFCDYIDTREERLQEAFKLLRSEDEAIRYCERLNVVVGTTKTQSRDHHQASKALVGAVTAIAHSVCKSKRISLDPNPQTRCVWCTNNHLHVTARNLDGAIPGLTNPVVVWEIKEYWGKTKGGSKMSDAVYECNLVGRELREFEERASIEKIHHVVFVDGAEQWSHRRSDLARFIDLLYQGLIDCLIIGREVETEWEERLSAWL